MEISPVIQLVIQSRDKARLTFRSNFTWLYTQILEIGKLKNTPPPVHTALPVKKNHVLSEFFQSSLTIYFADMSLYFCLRQHFII